MCKNVFVYGAENPAAIKLIEDFSKSGHCVYAGFTANDRKAIDLVREIDENIGVCIINPADPPSFHNAADSVRDKEGYLDILVLSAEKRCAGDGEIGDTHNYEEMLNVYDFNVNGVYKSIQTFLPLLRLGSTKRIAFLSHKSSSINLCGKTDDYAYHMSLAAINMMLKIYFNALRPEGFTFRIYCAGEEGEGKGLAMSAKEYILRGLYYDLNEAFRSEENRLVMRDCFHREIPW